LRQNTYYYFWRDEMKLLTFKQDNALRLGIRTEKGVIDVAGAGSSLTMDTVIRGGAEAIVALQAMVDGFSGLYLAEKDLTLGPCVGTPEKIICVGLNYRSHVGESGMTVPKEPVLFSKFNNALAAAGEVIPLPGNAAQFDYEVEVGLVIGREARNVRMEDALEYVFGYFTANDLSARDLQFRSSQWLLGKTPDKFFPVGPYLVTADEVGDPQNLTLSCWVNGERRQHANTSHMIFSMAEIIRYASQYMTLKPGDVISTGTPEGVILGIADVDIRARSWLKPGDEVAVEVEGLGRCGNRMRKQKECGIRNIHRVGRASSWGNFRPVFDIIRIIPLSPWGERRAGGNGVDGDVVRAEGHCNTPSEHFDAAFGHAVHRPFGEGAMSQHRGHEQNPSGSTLGAHLAGGGLGEEIRPAQVDADDAVKFFGRHVKEVFMEGISRVGDGDVHPAKRGDSPIHQRAGGRHFRDIAPCPEGISPFGADRRGGPFSLFSVHVIQ
jgi:2-keto-4-pentenoate hydratase/2-oxohepta-3-ene-1,7-dioic acid hydratase in catechol pathway